MKEKPQEMPPKALEQEWEEKLQSFGLPSNEEILREQQEQVPVLESIDEEVLSKKDLARFAALSQETKRAIIDDIKSRNIRGVRIEDIAERARTLITQSEAFETLDPSDSDLEFHPDESSEDSRTPEQIEEDLKRIEKIIEELEKAFREQEMGDAGDSVH